MSSDESIQSEIQRIRDTVGTFREAQIYITFARLDIAEALRSERLTVDTLADRINVDAAALQRFVEAATALGLLEQSNDTRVGLSRLGREMFVPGSPNSVANALKLEGAFYERWGRLAKAIRIGGRPPENRAQEDESDWVRTFTLALYENSRETATAVAEAIDALLPESNTRGVRVLDLGGGHGGYSLALAERRSDVRATVFDLPAVVEVTSEIVTNSGLGDRVSVVAGDFHRDPIGQNYDMILLFGVLHGEASENAQRLLTTIRNALSSSGRLVIRSRGHARTEPAPGEREIFDLHMLLSTEGGSFQRPSDTTSMVEQNGFRLVGEYEIPSPQHGSLLVFQPMS